MLIDDPFFLVTDCSHALIVIDENTISVRILGHLNPCLCNKGYLLPLVGKRFNLGSDIYEITMTEGVVGYPIRMAQMVTAVRVKDD